MLHPHVWELARDTLGCELLDYYGQAERVAFAYATEPREYRFLPGYAHVEFQPDAREERRHVLYEIVGTTLWNHAMPLLRYRTGDLMQAAGLVGRARARRSDARHAHFRAACSAATATS